MTSNARVRARSRAPYIRKYFIIFFKFNFLKFQSVSPEELILENRKMPSEWLGVHGGRSYGASPRGSSLTGPAVSSGSSIPSPAVVCEQLNIIMVFEAALRNTPSPHFSTLSPRTNPNRLTDRIEHSRNSIPPRPRLLPGLDTLYFSHIVHRACKCELGRQPEHVRHHTHMPRPLHHFCHLALLLGR
jgi:hypothetical protein